MENNKYLNEEEYQRNAKKIKRTGKIVLIVGLLILVLGIVCVVFGFSEFGKTGTNSVSENGISTEETASGIISSFGAFAIGIFLCPAGLFFASIGGMLLFVAHRREIAAFTTQQVLPVAKEGIDEMAPTIGNAAGEIAKGIKTSLDEANKKDE